MANGVTGRPRYYIGLANSMHDPALAIVGPDGAILFAEAAERYLQDKRAPEQRPDHLVRMPELLKTYCDPEAELMVATTWSDRFYRFLSVADALGMFNRRALKRYSLERNRALVPETFYMLLGNLQLNSFRRTRTSVLPAAITAFGHKNVRYSSYDHHLTHAAHSCFTSPFDDALCAVVDGLGEHGSAAFYAYKGGHIRRLKKFSGVGSLGHFYAVVTDACGFSYIKGEEWKVMGLAAYGAVDPQLMEWLRGLCRFENGRFHVPGKKTVRALVKQISDYVGAVKDDPLRAADLARSGQEVFIETMTALLENLQVQEQSDNLALGGGCALNSAYNGQILARTTFKNLYVPAAPADDGNAIGAALLAYREDHLEAARTPPQHANGYPFLGSALSEETLRRVETMGLKGRVRRLPDDDVVKTGAELLAAGKIIGWLQGRAEFGPRALGNRSILADPRDAKMKDRINAVVKFREEFRPFAPAILHEFGPEYFEDYQYTPHMERALMFKPAAAKKVPAVVHVDGTGRLQSVTDALNPRYHRLITSFYDLAGVPVILNTSFNVMHKPIAHSVEDALGVFYTSGLDALILENLLIEK